MENKPKQRTSHKEADEIIAVLRAGQRQDMLILIVPSHDRNNKALNNQEQWAAEALDLFADLYGGATAFKTFKGVYKVQSTGEILYDNPILVESYVSRVALEDPVKLHKLVAFAKRLGKEMNQFAIAIVVNDVFHEIRDFA